MELTPRQKAMLDGTSGGPQAAMMQRLMRLLLRLGEINGADRFIDIGSVHVSGISYKSIGEPGLDFLEDLAACSVKVSVLTTINPAGIDLAAWESMGFDADFAFKQQRIIRALEQMGVLASTTCTPYLVGNLPVFGEHIAWAESSAVSYANSVIGARTNREGGPSALAAAVCGCTPRYGLHCDENRRPTVCVRVTAHLESQADFGALGIRVGQRVMDGIPCFTGIPSASLGELKALGAAMAASGAVALYHVEGITPEADPAQASRCDSIEFTDGDLASTRDALSTGASPDIIVFGCPHASLREIGDIARKVSGRKLKRPLWVCTARQVKQQASELGWTATIEQAGGRLVADTCMVVSPIESLGFGTIAVDSGKAATYLPGFCKARMVFGDRDALIEEACT